MSDAMAILGRQPALGTAELERLLGADALQHVASGAVLVRREPSAVPFARLGGTVKLCKVLTQLDFTDWRRLSDYLVEHVPKHTCCYGPGKLTFGLSTIGLRVGAKDLERTGLSVKKAVRAADDRPVRLVPTKTGTELSSAQVLHNHMTDMPFGMELVLIRDGASTWLCQTVAVQDIDAYAARDQARPKRDARVGMLPPKLAQIILNLASPKPGATVLDPFCGTGVVLQEALLMGYSVMGTDLESRMIEYTQANLDWLKQTPIYKRSVESSDLSDSSEPASATGATNGSHVERPRESERSEDILTITPGDATTHHWQHPFQAVACETYLGRPFTHAPNPADLRQVISDTNIIHKKFLRNLAAQTTPGTPLCLAVPAWYTQRGVQHLPVLDSLQELGYTRVSFTHAATQELIYHREGQIVGRELVVLIRK